MLSPTFTVLLSYILLYKYLAFILFIFLGSFILPLPDNTLLVAVGAFASQGYFNIFAVIIIAMITNVTADIFGYFLTYRYGNDILKLLRIDAKNAKFVKAEIWLKKYSAVTIFFTRIAGPFGPAINFLSGLIKFSFKKFLLADLLGNVVDLTFFTLTGYFLGNYWQTFLKNIQYFGWLIFLIFVLYLFYKMYLKSNKKI